MATNNITINDFINATKKVKINETPKTHLYKFMYKEGAWITKEKFCAESDKEAIFEADRIFKESKLQDWKHGVALWKNHKIIKEYRYENCVF